MNYDSIIIRYGEIALKGKETRRYFERILVKNIKFAFKKKAIENKIERERGRIYLYTKQINESVSILKKIFGIVSVSPTIKTFGDIESISKISVDISKNELADKKTFAVRATRTGKHNFTSQDVAIKIGSDIVKTTKAKVDLTDPDFELFIEVRNEKAFIFTKKIRGPGGMPIGSQGKVLAVVDGPYSILAAWYLIHRGCRVTFVITKKSDEEKLNKFSERWYISFDVFKIKSSKNFFKDLNEIASEKDCDAIVSSYNILYNSKKALADIKNFKKSVNLPVLYPLISMSKKEMNKKCREIGIKL